MTQCFEIIPTARELPNGEIRLSQVRDISLEQ